MVGYVISVLALPVLLVGCAQEVPKMFEEKLRQAQQPGQ